MSDDKFRQIEREYMSDPNVEVAKKLTTLLLRSGSGTICTPASVDRPGSGRVWLYFHDRLIAFSRAPSSWSTDSAPLGPVAYDLPADLEELLNVR